MKADEKKNKRENVIKKKLNIQKEVQKQQRQKEKELKQIEQDLKDKRDQKEKEQMEKLFKAQILKDKALMDKTGVAQKQIRSEEMQIKKQLQRYNQEMNKHIENKVKHTKDIQHQAYQHSQKV